MKGFFFVFQIATFAGLACGSGVCSRWTRAEPLRTRLFRPPTLTSLGPPWQAATSPVFFFFVLFLFLSQQIYASLRGDFGFCIQRWFSSCLGLKRSARLLLTFLDPRIIKMPQARQLLVLAVSCLTPRSRHLILAERSRITSEKKKKKSPNKVFSAQTTLSFFSPCCLSLRLPLSSSFHSCPSFFSFFFFSKSACSIKTKPNKELWAGGETNFGNSLVRALFSQIKH